MASCEKRSCEERAKRLETLEQTIEGWKQFIRTADEEKKLLLSDLENERQRVAVLMESKLRQNPDMSNLNDPLRPEKALQKLEDLRTMQRLDAVEELDEELDFSEQESLTMCSRVMQVCFKAARSFVHDTLLSPVSRHLQTCLDLKQSPVLQLATRMELLREARSQDMTHALAGVNATCRGILKEEFGQAVFNSTPVNTYISEAVCVSYILALQPRNFELAFAATPCIYDSTIFERFPECSKDSDVVSLTIWPALLEDKKVLLKGEVFTKVADATAPALPPQHVTEEASTNPDNTGVSVASSPPGSKERSVTSASSDIASTAETDSMFAQDSAPITLVDQLVPDIASQVQVIAVSSSSETGVAPVSVSVSVAGP